MSVASIEPVGREELAARRGRAIAAAEARGLDGLLIWARCGEPGGGADLQYFADHFSPFPWVPPSSPAITACEQAALVLPLTGEPTLVASGYISPTTDVADARSSWDLQQGVVAALRDHDLTRGRLGVIGAEVLPHSVAEVIRAAAPGLELVAADEISHELRRTLSDWEIGALRHAGRLGREIADVVIDSVAAGETEGRAIGAGLAYIATIPDCLHWTFLVGSGDRADAFVASDRPPWRPQYVYRSGDVMHFDCYGFVNGYPYDLARTTVVDGASVEQQRVIDGARGLCNAMAAALRPGVTARVLHGVGMEFLADAGVTAGELPGFGHGMACGFVRPYFVPVGAQGPDLDLELKPPIGLAFETFVSDRDHTHFAAWEENYLWLTDGTIETTTA